MNRPWPFGPRSRALALVLALGVLVPQAARAFCSPDGYTETCTVCGQLGSRTCVNSVFTPCQAAELCNNCDDDADGVIDNAYGQGANSLTQPCSNFACNGIQRCQAGAWLACTSCAPKAPAVGCTTACGQATTYSCDPATCAPSCRSPYAETCNGVDDDCDGAYDEGGVCRQDCCPATCGARCGAIPGGNGCGGPLTCPSCPGGQICQANNTCCTLGTCSGFCGANVPDGCGGYLTCGGCPSGYTCNPTSHQCTCTPHDCTGYCGANVPDGCGGLLQCSGCGAGKVCTSSHTCCTTLSCGSHCGPMDNGCGGTMNCGTCSSGVCCDNVCHPNCN